MTTMLHKPDVIGQPGQVFTLDLSRPVHFIGVGGIGMSGLARILVDLGYKVSGSDPVLGSYTRYLSDHGAQLYEGHAGHQVPENAIVVVSTAINEANPEIQRARSEGMPVVHRSDLLREILHGEGFCHQTVIGISGTHGKTSTTGMVAVALEAAGLSPTMIAGGVIPEFGTNAQGGNTGIAVAELDESDGTLIQYHPNIAVVLNLELDHAEHFPGGFADFVAMFRQFLITLPDDAKVWLNAACTESMALYQDIQAQVCWTPVFFSHSEFSLSQVVSSMPAQVITYHLAEIQMAEPGCYGGQVFYNNQPLTTLAMGTPGKHQLLNGLVALSVVHQLEGDLEPAQNALAQFKGMKRRFEVVGHWNGATLVDDYAHHPTEVKAILAAAQACKTASNPTVEGKLYAIFQPHRYTRLQTFWEEFQTCFVDADHITVLDVFEASENPIEGVHSSLFTEALQSQPTLVGKPITYFGGRNFEPLKQTLKDEVKPGDWVITLGAGDVTGILRGWTP